MLFEIARRNFEGLESGNEPKILGEVGFDVAAMYRPTQINDNQQWNPLAFDLFNRSPTSLPQNVSARRALIPPASPVTNAAL